MPAPPTALERLLALGTAGYPPVTARRLRQANGFAFLVALFYLVFGLFFAAVDWSALKVLVAANLAMLPLLAATPLLHRFGEAAGMLYVAGLNGVSCVVLPHIAGSAAGLHYFLFAAPGAVVFFGPRWIRAAAVITLIFALAFVYVELVLPPYTETAPIGHGLAAFIKAASVVGVMGMVFCFVFVVLRQIEDAEAALTLEYGRSEGLLHNLMPTSIAERLKLHPDEIIAEQHSNVTILFADIVDFTVRAGGMPPRDLIAFLNRVFSAFDELAERHGVEKIKTIGDAYMVAGGMPRERGDHAAAVADMALDMLAAVARLNRERGDAMAIRIGIHTGPAVAGVIGTRKLFYDVWGDTVNTASRMESHGSAGRIQVTAEARAAIGSDYVFERRGVVDVKGKGEMELFYLAGRAASVPAGRASPRDAGMPAESLRQ